VGFGLGVVLVVAGAVLMWALDTNIPDVNDHVLGLILFVVGLATLAVALVLNLVGRRTTHIEEHRYNRE
jgi:uncharacterized protein DUF6458